MINIFYILILLFFYILFYENDCNNNEINNINFPIILENNIYIMKRCNNN